MAFVGIQGTIDFYIMQESDLTNQLTDIMMSITRASKETSSLAIETNNKKEDVKNEYQVGTDDYKEEMKNVEDEYEYKLAEITAWESELETQKNELETTLKSTTSYKESFQSALKSNVQNDFKYGGSSS